jgi:hypothetical protein
MFGRTVAGELLPWNWAQERLAQARTYWIATTRLDGCPHCRPVWGVWLEEGFYFSTGSLAAENLATNHGITVHLESGDQVLILEGVAERAQQPDALDRFVRAYNAKYGWDISPTEDGVADSKGNAGPAFLVRPRVAFGWLKDLTNATRWSFGP